MTQRKTPHTTGTKYTRHKTQERRQKTHDTRHKTQDTRDMTQGLFTGLVNGNDVGRRVTIFKGNV